MEVVLLHWCVFFCILTFVSRASSHRVIDWKVLDDHILSTHQYISFNVASGQDPEERWTRTSTNRRNFMCFYSLPIYYVASMNKALVANKFEKCISEVSNIIACLKTAILLMDLGYCCSKKTILGRS